MAADGIRYNFSTVKKCCTCIGNVWIYSTYDKFATLPGEPTYCHPTLYWFAFWLTTATYIILAVLIVLACVSVWSFVYRN